MARETITIEEHSDNLISSIKLPNNTTYEIHDAKAIHSAEELGLSAALIFMGTKPTEDELFDDVIMADVGDIWLVTETSTEYVCVGKTDNGAGTPIWEKLGGIIDAASSNHTHTVTTQSADVLGVNSTFSVTGGTATTNKMVLSKASVVDANGTPAGTVGPGSEAKWEATVDDGVLSFTWKANTPTIVEMPKFSDVTVSTGSLGATGTGAAVVTAVSAVKVSPNRNADKTVLTAVTINTPKD